MMRTLADANEQLARRGFRENFEVTDDRLRARGSGKTFRSDEVAISEYVRLEGASDPDEMSVIYAIETRDGTRGTLVDAFGVYADPAISAFLQHVPTTKVTSGHTAATE